MTASGPGPVLRAGLLDAPIDALKIDQSFVRTIPDDRASMEVTAGVIALAKSLNLEVLPEGVETQEQLEFLQRHDCDRAQGFSCSAGRCRGVTSPRCSARSACRARYRRRTMRKNASA